MKLAVFLLLSLTFSFSIECNSQPALRSFTWDYVVERGDTLFFSNYDSLYLDVFKNDTTALVGDLVLDRNDSTFFSSLTVDRITGDGYYLSLYEEDTLQLVEVRNYRFDGLGLQYYSLSGTIVLAFKAVFRHDEIDGVVVQYGRGGAILSVSLFEGGDFLRYLFYDRPFNYRYYKNVSPLRVDVVKM
ncbi:hypothetical protein [Phaeocystidibacter luteus]|uniref:Uncharacterized protein n=1 Tax=Phaeocystidibacter luteus TaxID=911197 RepID=A0A6N6RKH9_9FLAO|nr:hypothetical protein [Phaeocystidibacter luteus]KAB2807057.1 hypothetical protein F8C67_12750 [Phaeocystidibacter luteus]